MAYERSFDGERLTYRFPTAKYMRPIITTGIWVGVGIFVFALILSDMPEPQNLDIGGTALVSVVCCLPWAICVLLLLWQLVGEEVVLVDGSGITIRRHIWNMGGKGRKFTDKIANFRVNPNVNVSYVSKYDIFRTFEGSILFESGNRLAQFGNSIGSYEATYIIADIQKNFPQYAESQADPQHPSM